MSTSCPTASTSPPYHQTSVGNRRELRQSLGIADSEFLWLAAGRFEEPKDYPNLIAALSRLVRACRTHAWRLPGMVRSNCRCANGERRPARFVVRFLGFRDDVPALMAAADATVLASAWEGLPNVVIESLAVGTPIVCTDVGGIREVVDDGSSGLIVAPTRAGAACRRDGDDDEAPAERRQ